MRTFASTTRSLLATWLLCATASAGCAPKADSYADFTSDEISRLRAGEPAPFTGWLVSDADLEAMVKGAR